VLFVAVLGGAKAAPGAVLVGFCAKTLALPKLAKAVISTAICDFVFMRNYSRSRAFFVVGFHLPGPGEAAAPMEQGDKGPGAKAKAL
jgi:hypothetical protein